VVGFHKMVIPPDAPLESLKMKFLFFQHLERIVLVVTPAHFVSCNSSISRIFYNDVILKDPLLGPSIESSNIPQNNIHKD
jgi:hypothetical protein